MASADTVQPHFWERTCFFLVRMAPEMMSTFSAASRRICQGMRRSPLRRRFQETGYSEPRGSGRPVSLRPGSRPAGVSAVPGPKLSLSRGSRARGLLLMRLRAVAWLTRSLRLLLRSAAMPGTGPVAARALATVVRVRLRLLRLRVTWAVPRRDAQATCVTIAQTFDWRLCWRARSGVEEFGHLRRPHKPETRVQIPPPPRQRARDPLAGGATTRPRGPGDEVPRTRKGL